MVSQILTGSANKVLLIIPCFNEAESIGSLLDEIGALGEQWDITVIDDGSTDDTGDIAGQNHCCIRLNQNLGIGGAVQTGIKFASRARFSVCVQVDGDGQHPPVEIKKLLDAYEDSGANLVIGSRYIDRSSFTSSWARQLGGRIIAGLLNITFAEINITDPTSGFRLMDKKAIALFSQHYPHDFPEPVSIAHAVRAGLSVAEVPIKMRERKKGASSINNLMSFSYMIRVVFYIIVERIRRNRI